MVTRFRIDASASTAYWINDNSYTSTTDASNTTAQITWNPYAAISRVEKEKELSFKEALEKFNKPNEQNEDGEMAESVDAPVSKTGELSS